MKTISAKLRVIFGVAHILGGSAIVFVRSIPFDARTAYTIFACISAMIGIRLLLNAFVTWYSFRKAEAMWKQNFKVDSKACSNSKNELKSVLDGKKEDRPGFNKRRK